MASRTEPHHAHLAEMRASRPNASAADELRAIAADVGRGAAIAADHDAKRLAACYPDPTRRHLAEMRMTRAREEVRRG